MALRNSYKEDLGNFPPTDFVLGSPIRLPAKFLYISNHDGPEADPDAFVSKFGHFVASFCFMPPSQVDRASFLEKNLFSPAANHVYVLVDSDRPTYNLYINTPTKYLLNFSSIFSSTCSMA